jgi:hypothetical protein
MFDPKEVEAYRKISAPADLRERVLSSYADIPSAGWNPYSMLRMASSVAACLVLVIVLSVFTIGRIGDASVSVSGESLLPECSASVHPEYGVAPLSVQPIAKSMTPSVSLPITLTLAEKTVISVSDGALSLMGEPLSFGIGDIRVQIKIHVISPRGLFVLLYHKQRKYARFSLYIFVL